MRICTKCNVLVSNLLFRAQPIGEPDVTNLDVHVGPVVEKQPDISPPAPIATVTIQPELATGLPPPAMQPTIERQEPAMVTKDQPTGDHTHQEPLPVLKQPVPKNVNQPEPLVIYGRGAASKAEGKAVNEPGALKIRDFVVANISSSRRGDNETDKTRDERDVMNMNAPSAPELSDIMDEKEQLLSRQREHDNTGKTQVYTPLTWSPGALQPSDDIFSTSDLLAETFNGFVGATASAASAVYEGVSNALNSRDKLPQVAYQNDKVVIKSNNDSVDGIPRPLQVCLLVATVFPPQTVNLLFPSTVGTGVYIVHVLLHHMCLKSHLHLWQSLIRRGSLHTEHPINAEKYTIPA